MLPVLPRALSQAEQAKVTEACNQAAVVLDIDMSSGYPVISFLGMAERVRKVSSVLFCRLHGLCWGFHQTATRSALNT